MNLPLKSYWQLLARHIRPQQGRFSLLAVLLLGGIGLQIVNPQIMRAFIDSALGGETANRLLGTALLFIGIALVQQLVSVSVTYLGENVAWTATNALRAELAWHCLNLDMSFHNEHTPGELIERIDGDVAELANFFSQFVVILLGNLLLMVGVLIALLREDWRAGLAFSVFALVALVVLNRVRNIAMPEHKARRQAEADLFGFLEEQLSGAEDVRSSGAVSYSIRELFRHQAEILRHNRKAEFKSMAIGMTVAILLACGNILAVGNGYFLYTTGAITIGTVYLFVHYINMIEGPIWTLTHQVQSFQTIGACVERLAELRKLESQVKDGAGAALPAGPLALAFERVSFSYQPSAPANPAGEAPAGNGHLPAVTRSIGPAPAEMPQVLKDVTFRLEPGKVLGLLGRTGSGKTTLARLVFRLYDPTGGLIRLDGADLRSTRLEALRKQIAIVTQDVQLFRASVRDNLTFFDRSISDDQIQAAIAALDLADWYQALPAGLDTRLETGAHSLSAGEAQLLAFTRVFLRDPGLVILDEASSRLDPATEQHIERAIDKLLQNRTAIIIAHRLGTVGRADEIIILENGQVSELGRREQLAREPGSRFYQLLQTGLEEVLA